eukprot:10850964-Lingulodinium_polyedra.AAC.1
MSRLDIGKERHDERGVTLEGQLGRGAELEVGHIGAFALCVRKLGSEGHKRRGAKEPAAHKSVVMLGYHNAEADAA